LYVSGLEVQLLSLKLSGASFNYDVMFHKWISEEFITSHTQSGNPKVRNKNSVSTIATTPRRTKSYARGKIHFILLGLKILYFSQIF